MAQSSKPAFGKWRSFLWPIHAFELKKLLPMLLLFFFINFNYTILRDTKDTLIVTASGSGAEAIPFLKVWGVLPLAILFMVIYAKMSNKLSKKQLFYVTLLPFLVFFALFATVLYPARDYLHPHALADSIQGFLPTGFSGFSAVIRNWTFSLFYVMAELWGSVGISLLFWGFANDITRVSESKRFYAMFGIGANLANILSGSAIKYFSNVRESLAATGADPWGYTLNWLMLMTVVSGAVVMGIYWWINKNVLTDARFYDAEDVKKPKSKPKLSIKESLMFLAKSKYILCIAILVIAYGIAINLVEVTWKSQLKLQYPTPNEYSSFMGGFSIMTGIAAIFMMLFVGGNVMRRFGWTAGAMFTPTVLAITGFGFFAFVLFKDSLTGFTAFMGATPLLIAVWFGTIQNVLSKSSKYSLFDPTKEMAYIPLDQESKVKGKAAIDVVGARLGKAGGSLLQQGLFLIGPLTVITPYIAAIVAVIVLAWIIAAKSLGKQFNALQTAPEPTPTKPEAETASIGQEATS